MIEAAMLRSPLRRSTLALLLALTAACDSTEVQPQVPVAGGGVVGVGDLSGTPQPGQQWSIPDAGSGAGIGENRPKMNDSALGLYQQGMSAFVAGDLATAKQQFTAATQADSNAFQAFYSLGVVQERLKDDSGALSSYRQAYTLQKDYEPAIVSFGLLKARKGQISDADAFLTQKRNELPKSAAVLTALAETKSLAKDTGSAQSLASEALKMNPDYKPAMVVIARDYYRGRKLDLANYALQAILDGLDTENPPRDKENAEAFLIRALINKEQGFRAKAISDFESALRVRPDLVEARVQLATFYLQAGDSGKARPLVEGALRFDTENVLAQLLLGDCYRLEGKAAEAKQRFDYVVKRDASMPQVHYNLGLLYLFSTSVPGFTPMQQIDAAKASFTKYQELRPSGTSDDSDELLNRVKLKRGELEAAAAAAQPQPAAPPPAEAKPAEKPAEEPKE
jgi:Tfp pilus assembly protein PilF